EIKLEGNFDNTLSINHNRTNGGTTSGANFPPPTQNVFFHLGVVYDGTKIRAFYNGVQQTPTSGDGTVTAPLYTNRGWVFGRTDHPAFGGQGKFKGNLDEIELFNRALSASEIQAIYNAGSAGKCRPTPTPTPSPTCTPPPPNMVSWWPGDGNANDIQGGNNGTLQNGATFAAGMVGQAFSFDGVDDYVQATDTGLPFGSAARTLDLWMKPGSNGVEVPAIYGNFAANDAFYIVMLGNQTCIGRWGGGDVCGARNIRDGNWHHVALTYDGVSSVQLFIDGSLETSDTRTYSTTSRGKFYIGSTVEGSSQYYDGRVDEVEIFNRALSVSEIQAIYNAG